MHRSSCQPQTLSRLGFTSLYPWLALSPLRVPTEAAFSHLTFPKAIPFLSFHSSYGRGWQKLTPQFSLMGLAGMSLLLPFIYPSFITTKYKR